MFKKYLTVAVLGTALLSTPAQAGGMAEPIMDPEVIAERTTDSGNFILPLILLALIAAAIATSGGGGGCTGGCGTL